VDEVEDEYRMDKSFGGVLVADVVVVRLFDGCICGGGGPNGVVDAA
jgi:hypothetical protein